MLQSNITSYARKSPPGVSSITYSTEALRRDLERVQKAFRHFQRNRVRDAVFPYLSEVFALVEWWTADKREISRAHHALDLVNAKAPEEIEPFAAVIIASAYPAELDKRTISKYSRVLRYAARFKLKCEPLQQFIARKGGLNECAAKYARRLGRLA
jgi:hypothetical protein